MPVDVYIRNGSVIDQVEIQGKPVNVNDLEERMDNVATQAQAASEQAAAANDGVTSLQSNVNSISSAIENVVKKGIADNKDAIAQLEKSLAPVAQTADAAKTAAANAQSTADATKAKVDNATTGLAATKKIADDTKAKVDNATTGLAATKAIADAAKTKADTSVQTSGNQTIAGTKTFSASPVVPDLTAGDSSTKAANSKFVTTAIANKLDKTATAAAATKLATARTLTTNLASTTAASFDGSANKDIGVKGILPIANGGTGATTAAAACANLGALPLSGGKLSGDLTLEVSQPAVTRPSASAHRNYNFAGNDNTIFTIMRGWLRTDGYRRFQLIHRAKDGNFGNAALDYMMSEDGSVESITTIAPRDNYATDIVTTKFLKDYAPQKLTSNITIHVGGANASDTADLFNGRGLTKDKPFATLEAAASWLYNHCFSVNKVGVILHSDMYLTDDIYVKPLAIYTVEVTSDTTKRTIDLNGHTLLSCAGTLALRNLKLSTTSSPYFLCADGALQSSRIYVYGDVELNGTVTKGTIAANNSGIVFAGYYPISGKVTGKRYSCTNGGRILTNGRDPNTIPGTIAGTCDATSTVA